MRLRLPSPRSWCATTIVVSSVVLLLAGRATAIDQEPPPETPTFDDSIAVAVVEIPVRVLDGGEPVRNLRREDFVVLVDGEVQEIVGFDVIEFDGEGSTGRASVRSADPSGDSEAVAGRRFFLLFDLLFSRPHRQLRAIEGARTMVAEQLAEDDALAVGYLSSLGTARLVCRFTRNRAATSAALDAVEAVLRSDPERARRALSALGSRGYLLPDLLGSSRDRIGRGEAQVGAGIVSRDRGVEPPPTPMGDPVRSQVLPSGPERIVENLAQGPVLSAMRSFSREMARFARAIPIPTGRPELVFLSEGFDSRLLNSSRVLAEVDGMVDAFVGAGWTFHSVAVDGIPVGRSSGVVSGSLFYLANETGGDLIENYNRLDLATAKLVRQTSVLYLLAIRPPADEAEGDRRLEVRLEHKGWRTRIVHRPEYPASGR